MIPFKTIITLDRKSKHPLYLQILNQLVQLIKRRVLLPGAKLPGSRTMAELLGVHRKTVISAYEELSLQGWIIGIPKKGMFVHKKHAPIAVASFIRKPFKTSFIVLWIFISKRFLGRTPFRWEKVWLSLFKRWSIRCAAHTDAPNCEGISKPCPYKKNGVRFRIRKHPR